MSDSVLLLENIHAAAAERFRAAGFEAVERLTAAVTPEEMRARLSDATLLGIRSRTQITADLLAAAPNLRAIGCFCIGTNQVDLNTAQNLGAPVFNAPFANSRSVAELTIASIIHLMRGIPEKWAAARRGEWKKAARGSYEVRAKKLGIVGYGNIGSQLSVIASALGMHVYYYDHEPKLAHGNARNVASLEELLGLCDVVTLHVPSTPNTRMMMNAETLAKMKQGAFLINYARGDLVDIEALKGALDSEHLRGAALDVFPEEPKSNDDPFVSPLREYDNVLISPHIGGSTQEAQEAIGLEVADKLIGYLRDGATARAVNFPELTLSPRGAGQTRVLHIHRNEPGVLRQLNDIFAATGLNIAGQSLATRDAIGYVATDLEGSPSPELPNNIAAVSGTIRARLLCDDGEISVKG